MYHDVCGTLNGRCLGDGTLLYGCTCNLSITAAVLGSLEFDTGFPDAAFEVRVPGRHAREQAGVWAPGCRTVCYARLLRRAACSRGPPRLSGSWSPGGRAPPAAPKFMQLAFHVVPSLAWQRWHAHAAPFVLRNARAAYAVTHGQRPCEAGRAGT